MSEGKELKTVETNNLEITPMQMMRIAIEKDADLDKLQKLMDLQERWEAERARKAFTEAMNLFKANPPDIKKNKKVAFGETKYDYASLDHVSKIIGAELSKYGLSHRWAVEQTKESIKVTCVITHSMGHSESVSMEGPSDTSGKKNAIQSIGSTITYLERYTLLAATGIAVKGQDDDARVAGQPQKEINEDLLTAKILEFGNVDTKEKYEKLCKGALAPFKGNAVAIVQINDAAKKAKQRLGL